MPASITRSHGSGICFQLPPRVKCGTGESVNPHFSQSAENSAVVPLLSFAWGLPAGRYSDINTDRVWSTTGFSGEHGAASPPNCVTRLFAEAVSELKRTLKRDVVTIAVCRVCNQRAPAVATINRPAGGGNFNATNKKKTQYMPRAVIFGLDKLRRLDPLMTRVFDVSDEPTHFFFFGADERILTCSSSAIERPIVFHS